MQHFAGLRRVRTDNRTVGKKNTTAQQGSWWIGSRNWWTTVTWIIICQCWWNKHVQRKSSCNMTAALLPLTAVIKREDERSCLILACGTIHFILRTIMWCWFSLEGNRQTFGASSVAKSYPGQDFLLQAQDQTLLHTKHTNIRTFHRWWRSRRHFNTKQESEHK